MPCLIVLIALLLPRVAMILILLFTRWFQAVFDGWLLPLLGFIFMPYTTLAYLFTVLSTGGPVTAGWLILIILAVLVDIAHWGGGLFRRRRGIAR